jgi:hypothetical protein
MYRGLTFSRHKEPQNGVRTETKREPKKKNTGTTLPSFPFYLMGRFMAPTTRIGPKLQVGTWVSTYSDTGANAKNKPKKEFQEPDAVRDCCTARLDHTARSCYFEIWTLSLGSS